MPGCKTTRTFPSPGETPNEAVIPEQSLLLPPLPPCTAWCPHEGLPGAVACPVFYRRQVLRAPLPPLPFCPEVKLDSLAPKHRPAPRESTSASTTICPRAVKHQRSSKAPGRARPGLRPTEGRWVPRLRGGYEGEQPTPAAARPRRAPPDQPLQGMKPRGRGRRGCPRRARRERGLPRGGPRRARAGPGAGASRPAPPRPGSALCPRRRKLPPARSGRPAGRRGAARRGRASCSRGGRGTGNTGGSEGQSRGCPRGSVPALGAGQPH